MINLEEAKNLLKNEFDLSNEIMDKLDLYAKILVEENEKYNLTSITEPVDIYIKHFYDSLLLTKINAFNDSLKLIDLGTGAGFPGMVLKICYPNLDVTLLDATEKKCAFLGIVRDKLDLKKLEIINSRIEELDQNYVERYDLVTARAVSKINILLELSARLMKINGKFVALRGASYLEEEISAKSCLHILKIKEVDKTEFSLPNNAGLRGIIIYEKEEKTDKQYPRRYAQILKKPL